jgi:hypothetical protein
MPHFELFEMLIKDLQNGNIGGSYRLKLNTLV